MPKNNSSPKISTVIEIGDLRDKIYTIRGKQVILDSDLAKIYGYETKNLNRQVKNNLGKFEGEDFMFQLTRKELDDLSRCIFFTLNIKQGENIKYLPYAFTEQGIYMLMTVLKGDLATRQSRALIRTFKAMKDYVLENREAITYRNSLQLALRTTENIQEISLMKSEVKRLEQKMTALDGKMKNVLMKNEITDLIQVLTKTIEQREYVLMDGQPIEATEAYIDIYKSAKKNIYIVDNYIDIRTLRHLQKVEPNVEIMIFSDNLGNYLHRNDYNNFKKEYPGLTVQFVKTDNRLHDRFIIIDADTENETIYHSGISEKDAGNRMSAITKFVENELKEKVKEIIEDLRQNPKLILK